MTDSPLLPTDTASAPVVAPQKATLSDLECATITVEIMLDVPLQIECKLIPQFRMIQLGNMIPLATPPIVDYKAADKPVYNYADPAYIASQIEVNFKRNCLRLAEMIVNPAIPGDTLEDKATYIREKIDPRVTEGLAEVITKQIEEAKVRILTRAETFHS